MSRFSAARFDLIDTQMQARVDAGDYERLEWAVGDLSGIAHKGRTAEASLYRIYSMTKPLVSVVALQLVEEGRLHLFHHVSKYLPEFAAPMVFTPDGPRRASKPMLLHHLLSHMSGLSYGFMADASAQMMNAAKVHGSGAVSLREDVAKIAKIPLQSEPGTRWRYSVSTDVLGALIEEIEQAPLGEILRRRITEPLGMEETGFCPGTDARIAPIMAGGKFVDEKDLAKRYPADDPDFARGGHGLFSSLEDYARFTHALLQDATGAEAPKLLSPSTIAHATVNHAVLPLHLELPAAAQNPGMAGQGFGLGFAVSQPGGMLISRPGAFGWSGAAETWFTVDPKANLFAVLMAGNHDWPGASFDLQNMAHGALTG